MRIIKEIKHNDTYREIIKAAVLCAIFFVWTMLSHIFLFLPPMIGLLFIIFIDLYQKKNFIGIIAIMFCLVVFESENQLPLGVLAIVFLIVNYIIVEKFNLIFGHNIFFVFWYVGLLYLGYFLVIYIIKMFGSGLGFSLHSIFVFYFLCESCIGLFYEKFKY